MDRMVADAEGALDQDGHTGAGPDLAAKAEGLGTACQERGQVGALLGCQLRCGSRRRMVAQGLDPLGPSAFEPLAHRAFRDTERHGNIALLPVLLGQLPGAEPAVFFPVGGGCVLVHAPCRSTSRATFTSLCCAQ